MSALREKYVKENAPARVWNGSADPLYMRPYDTDGNDGVFTQSELDDPLEHRFGRSSSPRQPQVRSSFFRWPSSCGG